MAGCLMYSQSSNLVGPSTRTRQARKEKCASTVPSAGRSQDGPADPQADTKGAMARVVIDMTMSLLGEEYLRGLRFKFRADYVYEELNPLDGISN